MAITVGLLWGYPTKESPQQTQAKLDADAVARRCAVGQLVNSDSTIKAELTDFFKGISAGAAVNSNEVGAIIEKITSDQGGAAIYKTYTDCLETQTILLLKSREVDVGDHKQVDGESDTVSASNQKGGEHPTPGVSQAVASGLSYPSTDHHPLASYRLVGNSVSVYPKCSNCAYSGSLYIAAVSLYIENDSDADASIAVAADSLLIGPCGGEQFDTSGVLAIEKGETEDLLQYTLIQAGARLPVTSKLYGRCVDGTLLETEVTEIALTFLISVAEKTVRLPLMAVDVPVRVTR